MLPSEMGQIWVVEEVEAAAVGTCQRRTGNSFPAPGWKEKERGAEGRRVAARSGRSPPRQQSLSSPNGLILERLEHQWIGRKNRGLITPV